MHKDSLNLLQRIKLTIWGFRVFGKANPGLHASILLASVLEAISPFVTIYFTARLLDAISSGTSGNEVWRALIFLLAGNLGIMVLVDIAKHYQGYRQGNVHWTNRAIIGDKMLSLDFPALNDSKTQDLKAQVENNTNRFGYGFFLLRTQLENGIKGIMTIGSSVALTVSFFQFRATEIGWEWLNSGWVMAAALVVILVTVCLSTYLASRNDKFAVKHVDEIRPTNIKEDYWYMRSFHVEGGITAGMRIFREDKYLSRIMEEIIKERYHNSINRYARGKGGICSALSVAVTSLFMGLVYVLVCLKSYAGAFGIGYIAQYVGAITALTGGIAMAAEAAAALYTNAAYLKTAHEFLNISNDMYQGSLTTEKRNDCEYDIEFRDVSFKYPETDTWALRHVSVKFKAGKRMAVVGRNGSGKSTFIKLLCRLYDPNEGEIFLNGIDIRKYNYEEYQKLFSVVFQDYYLIDAPIAHNIAASDTYDEEKVKDVLEKVGLTERVASMKKGIETHLDTTFDDEGIQVSGGEAQKLAIARGLYSGAPFLIMDEPTAALDPMAEADIYQHLDSVVENKTAIYISHRLSTCRFCDEILVFDQGQVVQKGTHEDLVKENGKTYSLLWNAQAQYYQE